MAQPAPSPQRAPFPDPLAVAAAEIRTGQDLALARNREDLVRHLEDVRERLAQLTVPVAVVGEFKQGKSTLVNALLQTGVCPVDADVVTAVPTLVRYGDPAAAVAYAEPMDDTSEPAAEPVPLEAVADFVSEIGNPGNRRKLRSVEVRLPHLLLRSGLCLIDTPGVGGLESAQGVVTLSALSLARGMLFLTDASQELTKPELTFLQDAVKRCPLAACVITKIDLYPEWRRILDLNRTHLRGAGLELPMLPVSSFLRLRAREDPELLDESGFSRLVDFVAGSVVRPAVVEAAAAASRDVDFITSQIGHQVDAEQQVLTADSQEAPRMVQRLTTARGKTERLLSPTASWQQLLTDGIQDLVAEVEFDLQERLRAILRNADAVIEQGDPKETWADIEVWLRRQVITAAVANFDLLAELAAAVASRVASAFQDAAGELNIADARAPTVSLEALPLATAESLNNPVGRLASFLLAGRTAAVVPMLLVNALGSLLGPMVGPIAAMALAAGIGQKVIRDELTRQVIYRQQQGKQAIRRYVDEVSFLIGKESRDALRGTQRQLRDEFQARAATLHRTSESALSAARRAIELAPAERETRAAEVAREAAEIQLVRDRNRVTVLGMAAARA